MATLEIRNLHVSVADKQILKGINLTIKENVCYFFLRRSTQVGRRGAPAKGVGRETGARVQIPLSPLNLIENLKKRNSKKVEKSC